MKKILKRTRNNDKQLWNEENDKINKQPAEIAWKREKSATFAKKKNFGHKYTNDKNCSNANNHCQYRASTHSICNLKYLRLFDNGLKY